MSDLNEQLRAEFEAWAETEFYTTRDESGDYINLLTRCAWDGFKAARCAPAAAPAPVAAGADLLPDAEEYFREQLSESGMRKYLADEAISLTAPVWCEILQDYARAALAAVPAAAPTAQATPPDDERAAFELLIRNRWPMDDDEPIDYGDRDVENALYFWRAALRQPGAQK